MAEQSVVAVIVAALLIGGVILIGLYALKNVRGKVNEMLPAERIYDSCKWWLNAGEERFSVAAIKNMNFMEILKAYSFNQQIKACYEVLASEDSKTDQEHYSAIIVQPPCTEACELVVNTYEACRRSCQESSVRECFVSLLKGSATAPKDVCNG